MSDPTPLRLRCIVSGGQTGVDRGALDAAISLGIEHGGWCPLGRLAEDGRIPPKYELREMHSAEYPVRTSRNVLDSDGTLILYRESLQGGTELTFRLACQHGKPHLLSDLSTHPSTVSVLGWLREHDIQTLNVAGPRESSEPGIGEETYSFLMQTLRQD